MALHTFIDNKYFLVKKDDRYYCSKCGKEVCQTIGDLNAHESYCGKFENINKTSWGKQFFHEYGLEILTPEDIYGFFIEKEYGYLVFNFYKLELIENSAKTGFSGSRWIPLDKISFGIDKNEIIDENHTSEEWFDKLTNEFIYCINEEEPEEIIKSAFPVIPFIYSYKMFLKIYKEKGYKRNNINIYKTHEHNIRSIYPIIKYDNEFLIDVFEQKIDDEYVLELNIYKSHGPVSRVFVSENFYYSFDRIDLKKMFANKDGKFPSLRQAWNIANIDNFIKKYPNLKIDTYLAGGAYNLFEAVMCSNYNTVIELLSKAGFSSINSKYIDDRTNKELFGNNIKEIYGVTVNTLNFVKGFSFFDLTQLIKLKKEFPEIFLLDLDLNLRQEIYELKLEDQDGPIHTYKAPKNLVKIVKYCKENNYSLNYYLDYLNMMNRYEVTTFGKYPKDLFAAHDRMVEISRERWELDKMKRNRERAEMFEKNINSEEYKKLLNTKNDNYIIIKPETIEDLNNESNQMHNCVRTYWEKIANGNCYIFFVRNAKNINESLATIEVLKKENLLTLIQAKGPYNKPADISVQKFIIKWTQKNEILISTNDINPTFL